MASEESWSNQVYAEDQIHYLEEKREPGIVAVFNGKVLEISNELITEALSGISVKHYDGNCVSPEESLDEYFVFGEDYELGYDGGREMEEEEAPSKTMSSMIRLCYEPRKRGSAASENVPEDMSDYPDKPLCLQQQINFRNSFWDLHRPELCKLTWPHVYVGEATVTEHLHRHLRKHGVICSEFHDPRDMMSMLDKELDLYDKLKTIESPRELPPDGEEDTEVNREKGKKARKMKWDPCRPTFKPPPPKEDNDDDLDPSQMIRRSKEEFCITIGRPARRKAMRDGRMRSEVWKQLWAEEEWGEFNGPQEYSYPSYCSESTSSTSERVKCEAEDVGEVEMEEEEGEEESAQAEPAGWVEPDFCAMI